MPTSTPRLNYDKTYWNHAGTHQSLTRELQAMVPISGGCPEDKPKLERFRKASNLYYDLYNNGGCNYGKEIGKMFGGGMRAFNSDNILDLPRAQKFVEHVEEVMDKIIWAAAEEATR